MKSKSEWVNVMNRYNWSKYIRGLDCRNGMGLFHHVINKNVIISTSELFEFVEEGKTENLPGEITERFIKLGFIVPEILDEDKYVEGVIFEKIEAAKKGKLLEYCRVDSTSYDEIYVQELLNDLCRLDRKCSVYLVCSFDEKLLTMIAPYVGMLKFIMYLDVNDIGCKLPESVLWQLSDLNIGLYVSGVFPGDREHSIMKKYLEYDFPMVLQFNFQNEFDLVLYEKYIELFWVNLNFHGNTGEQNDLISIYNKIILMRQQKNMIGVNWDTPLNRLRQGLPENQGGCAWVTLKAGESLFEALNSQEYLARTGYMKEELANPCHDCGLEGICERYFLDGGKKPRQKLCFLAKYAIAEYISDSSQVNK